MRSIKANSLKSAGISGLIHLLTTCIVVAVSQAAHSTPFAWEQPYQAGIPMVTRDRLKPLAMSRCLRDEYNKCTFSAAVDYDRDGRIDKVRMMEGGEVSALVVEFGGPKKREPLAIGSFKGAWNGSCYIERSAEYKGAVAFTCPEASAAVFAMRNGRPSVRWLAD